MYPKKSKRITLPIDDSWNNGIYKQWFSNYIYIPISHRRAYGKAEWAAYLIYGQYFFLQLINIVYKLEILDNRMF